MDRRIDRVDKRILYRLAENARNTSAPMIAEESDVTAGTIRNRIRQLESAGIIRGFHADIDYERVEGRLTNLFVCSCDVADREALARETLDISGVVQVTELMSGRGNLHVTAVGTDTDDVTRVARELTALGLEIEDEALVQQTYHHPYHPFGPESGTARSTLTDFRRLAGGAEVVDVTVTESASVAGRTIQDVVREGLLDEEALVVAIEREDRIVTPKGETTFEPGDLVTIFSRDGVSSEALRAFAGTAETPA
ncbi:MAG: TrkA C-terminal domain-containing protein [Halobacteriales archaeon]